MSEKPTIAIHEHNVYIQLCHSELVGIYERGHTAFLPGELEDYGSTSVTSLSADELWKAVREVILERAKDEGH